MFRKPREFEKYNMVLATNLARGRIKGAQEYAKALAEDPDQKGRLVKCLCKVCHYSTALGGQAITTQPCACCDKPEVYSSTNTDALCLSCAQEHSLCKHCMGDLFIRAARSKWPERAETEEDI